MGTGISGGTLKQSDVAATYQSNNYVESKNKRAEGVIQVIIIMATYCVFVLNTTALLKGTPCVKKYYIPLPNRRKLNKREIIVINMRNYLF